MSWFQYLPLALYVINILAFGWGAVFFFAQPGPTPLRYRIVQVVSIMVWVVQAYEMYPVQSKSEILVAWIGFGLLVSAALFLWALRETKAMRLSLIFSPDRPEFIVRQGPYRFLRHPFYSSYLLTYVLAAVFSATIGSWIGFIAMVILYVHAAKIEEAKFRSSPLADQYEKYRKEVPAFLPFC